MPSKEILKESALRWQAYQLERCYNHAEQIDDSLLTARISECIDRVHQLLAEE